MCPSPTRPTRPRTPSLRSSWGTSQHPQQSLATRKRMLNVLFTRRRMLSSPASRGKPPWYQTEVRLCQVTCCEHFRGGCSDRGMDLPSECPKTRTQVVAVTYKPPAGCPGAARRWYNTFALAAAPSCCRTLTSSRQGFHGEPWDPLLGHAPRSALGTASTSCLTRQQSAPPRVFPQNPDSSVLPWEQPPASFCFNSPPNPFNV